MEDLLNLRKAIEKRLHEIRKQEKRTIKDIEEYKDKQELLSKISDVEIMIEKLKTNSF